MPGWNTINCRYDGSGGWLTFDFFRLAMGEEIEEQQETTTTEVPVPFAWLADYFPEATNATDSVEQQIVNFEAIANRATGKCDSAGNPLSVWHDYVAGTDPTNMTSVFSAVIKMQDGKPVVGWSPKLPAAEEARRTYTVLGRKELDDANGWIDISTVPEAEKDSYRFFKVTVELP